MKNTVLLRDALCNLRGDSGASDDYCRGLVVGLVAGIMAATGKDYNEVFPVIRNALPSRIDRMRLPAAFRSDLAE